VIIVVVFDFVSFDSWLRNKGETADMTMIYMGWQQRNPMYIIIIVIAPMLEV